MKIEAEKYRRWTQMMFQQFRDQLGDVELNGHPTQRLPHNLNVSIKGIESRSLIVQLKHIAISTGSACTSASVEPSHVILALGFGEDRAHSAIRIGVGRGNSQANLTDFVAALTASVQRVMSLLNT